jgi:protein HIRA/HIR1
MVIAEIPLWLLHSSGSKNVDSPFGSQCHRAEESLLLLESGGSKCPIYSVDFHPDGSKLATGGGDGTVRIWTASALFAPRGGSFGEGGAYASSSGDSSEGDSGISGDEQTHSDSFQKDTVTDMQKEPIEVHDINPLVRRKNETSNAPSQQLGTASNRKRVFSQAHSRSHVDRLLCTLSAHTGSSVLAVRFSTSGKFLASAGDDAAVCIYAPTTNTTSQSTGGNLSDQTENWSRVKLCRGHTLDVVGLAWSPDDLHLVSCSLDSDAPIVVWRLTDLTSDERRVQAHILCQPHKILGRKEHTSTVKGVTFDPAGSYLASSGDDPAVCIWRAHDDWGLEKRIDASSGIFREWNDVPVGQTLFRRISWSTDGSYICSTNSSIQNKHVASTISREGWTVSGPKTVASGAANLVGHKQPVVVSRHCPNLINASKSLESDKNDSEKGDEEPDYATLIALGDKKGFVSIWSTRKSRPVFKLQCSESRCTVTDLAWGRIRDDIILLVSMLDGHVVAMKFSVPDEIGHLLSVTEQKRVFQVRYGFDLEDDVGLFRGITSTGVKGTPKLIENPLQLTLEEGMESERESDIESNQDLKLKSTKLAVTNSSSVQESQITSTLKGKKRIRPVLMTENETVSAAKSSINSAEAKKKRKDETLQDILEHASKVAAVAEDLISPASKGFPLNNKSMQITNEANSISTPSKKQSNNNPLFSINTAKLPFSTEKILSFELPLNTQQKGLLNEDSPKIVVDCTNANRLSQGLNQVQIPFFAITISSGGRKQWRDEIIGASCTALAATESILAVGTSDGCLYLFGTSPSLGWSSGTAFRSHPPFILGHAIVSIHMQIVRRLNLEQGVDMVILSADGSFQVYSILPNTALKFKGSILPAMNHMVLASSFLENVNLPKLARIQLTDSGSLLVILSFSMKGQVNGSINGNTLRHANTGGPLQAFVYDRAMELWLRISDNRFVFSDFYSFLPSTNPSTRGALSMIDDFVRSTAMTSSNHNPIGGRYAGGVQTSEMHKEDNFTMITRAHCEDRMACALALRSSSEFQYWLSRYVKMLTRTADEQQLRFLVDIMLAKDERISDVDISCWWLSSAPDILTLNRKNLVETVIVPQMSKNRALQRLTNEIALEINASI